MREGCPLWRKEKGCPMSYENVSDFEIRRQIVETAHLCAAAGLANAFEGNISIRKGDRVWCTPTQTSKELLTEGQVIVLDMDGNQLEGELKPTSEILLHLVCYRERPDVSSVVHCHPIYSTAFAQAGVDFVDDACPELQILFGGKIPCIPYGMPGTPAITYGLDKVLPDYDVVLLGSHGVVAVAETPLRGYSKIQSGESIVKIYAARKELFGDKDCSLTPEECELLKAKYFAGRK